MNKQSGLLQLNKTDAVKLGKSLGLSLAGCALLWITDIAIPAIDWASTSWGPFVGAMAPLAVNMLRKLLASDTK